MAEWWRGRRPMVNIPRKLLDETGISPAPIWARLGYGDLIYQRPNYGDDQSFRVFIGVWAVIRKLLKKIGKIRVRMFLAEETVAQARVRVSYSLIWRDTKFMARANDVWAKAVLLNPMLVENAPPIEEWRNFHFNYLRFLINSQMEPANLAAFAERYLVTYPER
ncbi:hypothetical protein OROMI_004632 [Orobanche minor]